MPKEIRQIRTHLWGERRDGDTPTDRKACASDKCALPSAKPFLWWQILQKPPQLPKLSVLHPFPCTTDLTNTGPEQISVSKEVSVLSLWTSIRPGGSSTSQMPSEGIGRAVAWPGSWNGAAGCRTSPLPSSSQSSRRSSPTPTSFTYASEEDVGGFLWSRYRPRRGMLCRRRTPAVQLAAGPVLNFKLFDHLLNCY